MERYIEDHLQPKLDALDRRIDKVEHRQHDLATKLNLAPSVEMEIEGSDPDFVLETMRRAYQLFGNCTNFRLKTTLKELVETKNAEGDNTNG